MDFEYKEEEELKDRLVGRSIVKWTKDYLKLDDGTLVETEMTESDCCALAYGEFKDFKLDAVITDVRYSEPKDESNEDTNISTREIVFIHNANPMGVIDLYADGGNGGYYFSVVAIKVNDIYFYGVSDTDAEVE